MCLGPSACVNEWIFEWGLNEHGGKLLPQWAKGIKLRGAAENRGKQNSTWEWHMLMVRTPRKGFQFFMCPRFQHHPICPTATLHSHTLIHVIGHKLAEKSETTRREDAGRKVNNLKRKPKTETFGKLDFLFSNNNSEVFYALSSTEPKLWGHVKCFGSFLFLNTQYFTHCYKMCTQTIFSAFKWHKRDISCSKLLVSPHKSHETIGTTFVSVVNMHTHLSWGKSEKDVDTIHLD